ncbi:pyridoxamine 5'-phosphate oxidase [Fluviicoccus keumensis]|uniref:Pyridoxamine 5'-phosphate oxidase n=1 Tax=Fluviicoccus keumensis TaxID=1435465 RepID=A0A4V2G6B1_9GAMM|nr:GAF domain-containing protein [Fluviicoccus keumensis]RZU47986.1 pyridoxamine 5'-phosphate oxidase [Fluviicoccus keumensis]
MKPGLDAIRHCLEGAIPGVVATCDADGVPNVSYVSQIHYADSAHVALSFQFFNKTRGNMLANPQLTAYLIDPETGGRYRLALLYLRTETEGPLFQRMKAKLAGIASQTGMAGVFRLRGADICRVLDIEPVPAAEAPRRPPACNRLSALHTLIERLENCHDMAGLFEETLVGLEDCLGIRHAMLMMADGPGRKLYTVASRGYACSGIGSEIPLGAGVIGVAAEHRTPIRITHMAAEYGYGKAVCEAFARDDRQLETAIPFPGLPEPHSQIAVPLLAGGRLLGVLYADSDTDLRFTYDDEDALSVLCRFVAQALTRLREPAEAEAETDSAAARAEPPAASVLPVRYFAANQSIFLGDDYLIKGVAGAILWRLLQLYTQEGRREFSNRELRLDRHLHLPDIDDNLEARLILLQRRLAEKTDALALVKTGRGRFRLAVRQTPQLLEQPAAS